MNTASSIPSCDPVTLLPEALNRHLSAPVAGDISSVADYIQRGANLVDPAALRALQRLRLPLRAKIEQLEQSVHLRHRLELLATFYEETAAEGATGTPAHRDVAFALTYFFKAFDRIPDTLPEVGLLDDAMIVQMVLQRHATVVRAHWLRRRRAWPSEL